MGVELKSTEQRFAPTAGAVVRVKFDTDDRGRAVVLRLRRPNGEPVPFAADVLDDKDNTIGSISQGSRAMFYTRANEGDVRVRWGTSADQTCKARYSLPDSQGVRSAATTFADAPCQ
ncbi:FimD/PapC C-terminal domain-containing protein [Candidatus Burkholderia verschuerenii]|uniref:FimD/PapC C-terminal domain-containing protein n=1 Tax=Candidatus Burkholderia verschuerenii TaxID=242163 RepID=UPI001E468A3E|nr:FimD/PapC C-terminal domain-containing protein [Candidatus Burkholderia verschuerenii]